MDFLTSYVESLFLEYKPSTENKNRYLNVILRKDLDILKCYSAFWYVDWDPIDGRLEFVEYGGKRHIFVVGNLFKFQWSS